MKKLVSQFLDNVSDIERKVMKVQEREMYNVLAVANLVRVKGIINKHPEGQALLQRLKDQNIPIKSDKYMEGGGDFCFDTCLAENEAKLAISTKKQVIRVAGAQWGLRTGEMMRAIFHEGQHQKQYQEGLGWPDTNNVEDYKIWRRFQEADAESYAISMAHDYKKKGMPQAWEACKNSLHGHIARAIDAKEAKTGRPMSFGDVRKQAFDGWFDHQVGWLVASYDQDAKETWGVMRNKHKHGLPDETQKSELTLKDFKKFNQVAGMELISAKSDKELRQSPYFGNYNSRMVDPIPSKPSQTAIPKIQAPKISAAPAPAPKSSAK